MRFFRQIGGIVRAEGGMAAMEFAFAAPILLFLLLNGVEMSRALLIHQKAEKVAYTVSDVVAQSSVLTTGQLNQIVAAGAQIMEPYAFGADGVIVISSVYQGTGIVAPVVRWQYVGGGSLQRASRIGVLNGTALLPDGLVLNAKDNIIVAEVFYRPTAAFLSESWTTAEIYKAAIFKPRLGALTTPPA